MLTRPTARSACRAATRIILCWVAGFGLRSPVLAQTIEPRLFANAPVDLNFLIFGYAETNGGVVLDPSVPLEDAHIRIHAPVLGYARSLDIAGLSGQIQIAVPYAWLSGNALLPTGERKTREVDGFGDPAIRFSVNVHGAPALTAAEFPSYKPDLVVGVSLQISAPTGQYDPDRLVNLGTNRWSFKPEFGFSKTLGRYLLEASGAVSLYTDNDDFYGGQHRSQDPIYSAQGHLIYRFRGGAWGAFDATYYTGGRTTLDGVEGEDLQRNWRLGLTTSFPLAPRDSMKVYFSDGVSTLSGEDFILAGVAWQHRWGGGM